MYLIGGENYGDYDVEYYNDVQQYDVVKGTLKTVPTTGTKPSPRSGHGSLMINDIVYLYGGSFYDQYARIQYFKSDIFSFNTTSQEWSAISTFENIPLGRYGMNFFTFSGFSDSFYMFGGMNE